jgi:hypothetical protein
MSNIEFFNNSTLCLFIALINNDNKVIEEIHRLCRLFKVKLDCLKCSSGRLSSLTSLKRGKCTECYAWDCYL